MTPTLNRDPIFRLWFDTAAEAVAAVAAHEAAATVAHGYEIAPMFDTARQVTGYLAKVKDVDGFTIGNLEPEA